MEIIVFILGMLLAGTVLISIVGITFGDMRAIRLASVPPQQPPSHRPLVTVVISDDICDDCIASIRHSTYAKKEIILSGEPIHGTLVLLPANNDIIQPDTIDNTVRLFEQIPGLRSVEILRAYKQPRTITELLRVYHDIVVAPFISVRETFRITPHHSRWSLLLQPTIAHNIWRTRIYYGFRWLASIGNSIVLLAVCYMAAVLHQPVYLQIYLVGFVIWMILAIHRYPHFSIKQRLTYIALAPVSLGYFALLAVYAPLSPIVRRVRDATGEHHWQPSHQPLA